VPVLQRIMTARYSIPPDVAISNACRDLLQKMLTVQPQNRITIASIKRWGRRRRCMMVHVASLL